MAWNWQLVGWGVLALALMAGEALIPGAALLWFGLAAAVLFVVVAIFPGLSVLVQVSLFIALSFAAVFVYRRWFRSVSATSDQPALNLRTAQLVGHQTVLTAPIVAGRGRVQIADAFWDVAGPELPLGARVRVVGSRGMTLDVEPV